jgi:hypothetical protein
MRKGVSLLRLTNLQKNTEFNRTLHRRGHTLARNLASLGLIPVFVFNDCDVEVVLITVLGHTTPPRTILFAVSFDNTATDPGTMTS